MPRWPRPAPNWWRAAPIQTIIRTRQSELDDLLAEADRLGAVPITTAKDAVRLPSAVRQRVHVLTVSLAWEDPDAPEDLLRTLINTWASEGRYRRNYA